MLAAIGKCGGGARAQPSSATPLYQEEFETKMNRRQIPLSSPSLEESPKSSRIPYLLLR